MLQVEYLAIFVKLLTQCDSGSSVHVQDTIRGVFVGLGFCDTETIEVQLSKKSNALSDPSRCLNMCRESKRQTLEEELYRKRRFGGAAKSIIRMLCHDLEEKGLLFPSALPPGWALSDSGEKELPTSEKQNTGAAELMIQWADQEIRKQLKQVDEDHAMKVEEEQRQKIKVLEGQLKKASCADDRLLKELQTCILHSKVALEKGHSVAGLLAASDVRQSCQVGAGVALAFDFAQSELAINISLQEPERTPFMCGHLLEIDSAHLVSELRLTNQSQLQLSQEQVDQHKFNLLKRQFDSVQNRLLTEGICMCGFNAFSDAKSMTSFQCLVSTVIGCCIGDSSVGRFTPGSMSCCSLNIEHATKKLCNNKAVQSCLQLYQSSFELCIDVIAEEVCSMYGRERTETLFWQDSFLQLSCAVPFSITAHVLVLQDQCFILKALVDMGLDATALLSIVQQEDLLKSLFVKRLQQRADAQALPQKDNVMEFIAQLSPLKQHYLAEHAELKACKNVQEFLMSYCASISADEPAMALLLRLQLEFRPRAEPGEERKVWQSLLDSGRKSLYRVIYDLMDLRRTQKQQKVELLHKEADFTKDMINAKEEEKQKLMTKVAELTASAQEDAQVLEDVRKEKKDMKSECDKQVKALREKQSACQVKIKEKMDAIETCVKKQAQEQSKLSGGLTELAAMASEKENVQDELRRRETQMHDAQVAIGSLQARQTGLEKEVSFVEREQKIAATEKAQAQKEAQAGEALKILFKNLQEELLEPSKAQEIREVVDLQHSLKGVWEHWESTSLLPRLLQGADEDSQNALRDAVFKSLPVCGFSDAENLTRLKGLIFNATAVDVDLLGRVFQVRGMGLKWSRVLEKVVAEVSEQLRLKHGLDWDLTKEVVRCASCGNHGLNDFPHELQKLVRAQLEEKFLLEDRQHRLVAKGDKLVQIIRDDLQLNSYEVVAACIDRIEVCCSVLYLSNCHNTSYPGNAFPGVGLSILCQRLKVEGDVRLDTSGVPGAGHSLRPWISPQEQGGQLRREGALLGKDGTDGLDGQHGQHAGHVSIVVQDKIENAEGLSITAHGGDAGKGQLAGSGEQGRDGQDGTPGKAAELNKFGGKQFSIGWGRDGQPGHLGGRPGASGRPGKPGRKGMVSIKAPEEKLVKTLAYDGKTATCCLQEAISNNQAPTHGRPGRVGRRGLDEMRTKESLFKASKHSGHIVIDNRKMAKNLPKFARQCRNRIDIDQSNKHGFWAIISGAVAFAVTLGIGVVVLAAGAVAIAGHVGDGARKQLVGKEYEDHFRRNEQRVRAREQRQDRAALRSDRQRLVNIRNVFNGTQCNLKSIAEATFNGSFGSFFFKSDRSEGVRVRIRQEEQFCCRRTVFRMFVLT